MQTVTLEGELPASMQGGCVALGNFDGLHAGHRAVIEGARQLAAGGAPLLVATFDPTPRDLFAPNEPAARIHTARQRQQTAASLGADGLVLIPFDRALSQSSDEAFVEDILVRRMGVKGVSVGFDFRFGRGRMGGVNRLTELCRERGIQIRVVDEVADGEGKLSSTRIREAIRQGDMAAAKRQLGDWWVIDAEVEDGEKRGRTLGFPTANMRLGKLVEPSFGVYAVWSRVVGQTEWSPGVASFGRTPTTGVRDPLLEVHLFDFAGNLYGKRLETAFVEFLRPEATFASIEELTAQMHRDKANAAKVLEKASLPQ